MTSIKLSAVVITFNEEENIERCIRSLMNVADEIVVVDSFSTDRTESICRSLSVKFVQHKFDGHIQQKNYAMALATNDYILSLDADEMVSDVLHDSIMEVKKDWRYDAYSINRLNNYCGKFIYHGNWYPDRKIRIWNRKMGKWAGENPHDRVVMEKNATVKRIKGDLLHYTYRTYADHLAQMNKFSDIAAREAFEKKKRTIPVIHLLLNPWFVFVKNYFLRLGFLDGYAGFIVAVNGAYYRFLKYAKLRHLEKNR